MIPTTWRQVRIRIKGDRLKTFCVLGIPNENSFPSHMGKDVSVVEHWYKGSFGINPILNLIQSTFNKLYIIGYSRNLFSLLL